jgi:hypothetical protein
MRGQRHPSLGALPRLSAETAPLPSAPPPPAAARVPPRQTAATARTSRPALAPTRASRGTPRRRPSCCARSQTCSAPWSGGESTPTARPRRSRRCASAWPASTLRSRLRGGTRSGWRVRGGAGLVPGAAEDLGGGLGRFQGLRRASSGRCARRSDGMTHVWAPHCHACKLRVPWRRAPAAPPRGRSLGADDAALGHTPAGEKKKLEDTKEERAAAREAKREAEEAAREQQRQKYEEAAAAAAAAAKEQGGAAAEGGAAAAGEDAGSEAATEVRARGPPWVGAALLAPRTSSYAAPPLSAARLKRPGLSPDLQETEEDRGRRIASQWTSDPEAAGDHGHGHGHGHGAPADRLRLDGLGA